MKNVSEAHKLAMALADEAEKKERLGDEAGWKELTRQAFEHERVAAALVQGDTNLEPTRSVLHRSAASLALECGEFREAERLIAVGLSGDPPEEIADELRDLMEQVHFERHLSARGMKLAKRKVNFVVAQGTAVGYGIAEADEVLERLGSVQKLLYRTAERRLKRPFREQGDVRKEIKNELGVFFAVPQAASFAVSLTVGQKEQPSLPGMGLAEDVIAEVLDCIELYNQGKFDELLQRIEDKSYYDNFVGLTRAIMPDGEKVKVVGFTTDQGEGVRRILLSKTEADVVRRGGKRTATHVEIRGSMRVADARKQEKGTIIVVDSGGVEHRVRVSIGRMEDIVRPLFGFEVIVTGTRRGKDILLENIDRVV